MKATTQQEENPHWHIIAESVKGATHERSGKPNQDALEWRSFRDAVILAIADGHGSDKYFRSHVGARFAVEVAVQEMRRFLDETATQQQMSSVERQAATLPQLIVERWCQRVQADLQMNVLTDEERKRYHNQPVLQAEAGKKELIPYGATVLAMLVTARFTFCLQLGDGDITFITADGKTVQPMAEDRRLLANETTSLCTSTAIEDFRQRFYQRKSAPPALVMLSTDGYANSFSTQEGFRQVGVDILRKLYEDNGLADVKAQLKGWLETATREGSGDDITVGMMCHLGTIRTRPSPAIAPAPPPPSPNIPPQTPGEQQAQSNQPVSRSPEDIANEQTLYLPANTQFKKPHNVGSHPSLPEQTAEHHKKTEIVVSSLGDGTCRTIREALDLVPPHGQIIVQPGIYRESLRIEKSIHLIAKPSPTAEVRIESMVPCLQILAPDVTIKGFRIKGYAQDAEKEQSAIFITQKECCLMQCDISSQSYIGVLLQGKETQVQMMSCQIHHTKKYGIVLYEEGIQLEMHSCKIRDIKLHSILIKRDCSLELKYCSFQATGINIQIPDSILAHIYANNISDKKGTNIHVKDGFLIVNTFDCT